MDSGSGEDRVERWFMEKGKRFLAAVLYVDHKVRIMRNRRG